MAEHAKLTLSLMRAGVPNMEILAATDLPALIKVAKKHDLERLISGEAAEAEAGEASAQESTDAGSPPSDGSGTHRIPTGAPHMSIYEGPGGVYEGERNEHGEWEGRGHYKFSDGSVYDGEWVANQHHGRGTIYYASGSSYEGQWVAGRKHGKGTYRWHDGRIEVGLYDRDQSVGEGVMWSADLRSAWRIVDDGVYVEEISLTQAKDIAERIGETPPSPTTYRGRRIEVSL
jgi:hypothetical protein